MNNLTLGIAFMAGLLSFLSPCILPLIPGYISFLSGLSLEELQAGTQRKKIFRQVSLSSISFVIGFSVIFIALGASATLVGKFLTTHLKILTKVAGIVIIILGLHLVGILKFGFLDYEKRLKIKHFPSSGLFSPFLMGLAFAFGWTPCIGPILTGILTLAATQKDIIKGMLLLAMYALGMGIPFIITGFSVAIFLRILERYKHFISGVKILAGLMLIVIGLLIFSQNLTILLKFVPSLFYKFAK